MEPADAHVLELAHHLRQHRVGGGGAHHDQQLFAEVAQERQHAHPGETQDAAEHRHDEDQAGGVEHQHQRAQVAERVDAVAGGGEGHRAEHAERCQAHDHAHDAEHDVAEFVDQAGHAAGLLADQVQGAAEQHGEQQDLEDVVLGEGAEHRGRDQAHEECHGAVDLLGAPGIQGDVAGGQFVEMDVGAAAQAQAVGDHQAEDQGDGGEDFEVDHRLQADAADLLQVTGAGDAVDHHAEDDQCDEHLDQLDEAIAQRLHLHGQVGNADPADHAYHQANHDLQEYRAGTALDEHRRSLHSALPSGLAEAGDERIFIVVLPV